MPPSYLKTSTRSRKASSSSSCHLCANVSNPSRELDPKGSGHLLRIAVRSGLTFAFAFASLLGDDVTCSSYHLSRPSYFNHFYSSSPYALDRPYNCQTPFASLFPIGLFHPRLNRQERRTSIAMILEGLPVEILQHIASFLTPDAIACFALCSKSSRWVIGDQSWLALRAKDQRAVRLRFLSSLQRGLRDWMLCYHCEKLHPFEQDQGWYYRDQPSCTQADGFVHLLPLFGMRFQKAQMIMQLHRLGIADDTHLDSLSRPLAADPNQQAHTFARIVNDHLLVKVECRIPLRRDEGFLAVKHGIPEICPHWSCVVDDDTLSMNIRCSMRHGPGHLFDECTGLEQCQWCSTEFVVACFDSEQSPHSRVVHVAVWKDLGRCETPFDVQWRNHIWPFFTNLPAPRSSTTFAPGSILQDFEGLGAADDGFNGRSSTWPLDTDVSFAKLVTEIKKGPQMHAPNSVNLSELLQRYHFL